MQLHIMQQINITLLFSEPFNQATINDKDLLETYVEKDDEKQGQFQIARGQNSLMLQLSDRQTQIIFERNRFLINKGDVNKESFATVVDILKEADKSGFIDLSSAESVGYNFDALIDVENAFVEQLEEMGGVTGIKNEDEEVDRAGVRFRLVGENGDRREFQIRTTEENRAHIHGNYHHSDIAKLKKQNGLLSQMKKDYDDFKAVIEDL